MTLEFWIIEHQFKLDRVRKTVKFALIEFHLMVFVEKCSLGIDQYALKCISRSLSESAITENI
jgi:hypothetical protein